MSRSLYCAHKAQRGYFPAWVGHYPRLMRFGFSQDVPNLGLVLTISPEFKISGRELGKKEGSFRRITWSSTEGAQRKQFRKGKKKRVLLEKALGGWKRLSKERCLQRLGAALLPRQPPRTTMDESLEPEPQLLNPFLPL